MKYLVLAGLGLSLLYWGGQGVYVSIANSEPTQARCGEHVDAEWVELTDCVYDLEHLVFRGYASVPTELFIPLRAPGSAVDAPATVVLATKDEQLLDWINAEQIPHRVRERAALTEQVTRRLEAPQRVRGLVQFGATLSDKRRDEISGLTGVLASDFIIVEEGEEPGVFGSIAQILGGLLCWAILIAMMGTKRKNGDPAVE